MTISIIFIFIIILGIGFRILTLRRKICVEDHQFAQEYRNTFIELTNTYTQSYDSWNRTGTVDNAKYTWLTMNVNKMQNNLGHHGRMFYVAPFRTYQIPNYQIVINTLPKFRDGKVQNFDINSVDDCLLRYIGATEEVIKIIEKKLRNPIIWFREGIQEIISLPIYIFKWFGLLSERNVASITSNFLYRFITGIGGLVAFASGIVTIIQGKQTVIDFIHVILKK